MKHRKEIIPLPFPVYFWPVVALVVIGFLDSMYLAVSHYRVHNDMSYESFCAISKAINCDAVSQSTYAQVLGVPLAVWGVLGYVAVLALLFAAYRNDRPGDLLWPSISVLSFVYCIHSIFLAYVSTVVIQSYCIMCVATYVVNFLLLFYAHMIYKRFGSGSFFQGIRNDAVFFLSRWKQGVSFLVVLGLTGLALVLFYPRYWGFEVSNIRYDLPSGLTESGHPWIGAENPELVIVEFTDYQCYQCRKMYYFFRQLMSEHPGKLRIVHRHFPMDHEVNPIVKKPFHVGSGKLALMAIHAQQEGRFWEMSDQLFSFDIKRESLSFKELAEKTGLDEQGLARSVVDWDLHQKLWGDIREGIALGITGTPTYVIDGKRHSGLIPPDILKRLLQ